MAVQLKNDWIQKSKNDGCMIIFTKDRPSILSKTIQNLLDIEINVIILDDSTSQETKNVVYSICDKASSISYHGKDEQKTIFQHIKNLYLREFIKPLGTNGWNLGFNRNYAIILSKVLRYKKVLFMDEDINIKDTDIIGTVMGKLNDADFVSAKISGMTDDSVVGHMMRTCGVDVYEFLSGGFLAFNLDAVYNYFLNYYNEDLIWLFLHEPKSKIIKYGEVYQILQDPFENAVKRALDQEFGEILADGVHVALNRGDFSLLMHKTFWDAILGGRTVEIERLMELCKGKNLESIAIDVCRLLLDYHFKVSSDTFCNVFIDYFNKRKKWLSVLVVIDNEKTIWDDCKF